METNYKISMLYFTMIILSCSAFTLNGSEKQLSRRPRSPRVVYDSRYDNKEAATETDIMQFKDNFGPKVQERLTEIAPSTSQSNVREQYQAFKDNTYNTGNNHGYSDRNFDFAAGAAEEDIESPGFHANEEQSSFEQGFAGNFETFDAGFSGDFFDNAENSGEKKDPDHSVEASDDRAPEFEANEDLSA